MKQIDDLGGMGVVQTVRAMEEGSTTADAVARACLERIAAANDDIKAFVALDPGRVLAEAAKVDAGAHAGGLLRGVPYAVKDVIDTADYPTAYGSPLYAGYMPGRDAACVRRAREQGSVLMGKVATGEFATQTPSQARNPLRTTHTPGGSSSGSAAAVAAGMVPVAFGTQTTGSIVRPAVYCGLVGYKPSFGMLGTAGLKTLSHTQDTIGVIARDVMDVACFSFGVHGVRHVQAAVEHPRIALCRSSQWDYASLATHGTLDALAKRLASRGVHVDSIELPEPMEALAAQQPRLFMFEARQNLAYELETRRTQLSTRLQKRLDAAQAVTLDEYISLRQQVLQCQWQFAELMRNYDAILYPAAAGEAEKGLEEAGDPRFGALWTMLHVPTVSFPCGKGPSGLPLGVQLVGAFGEDMRLLSVAQLAAGIALDVG